MQVLKFKISGQSPLLMHLDDVEAADEVRLYRTNPDNAAKQDSPSGDDRFPTWTWQTYLYHDGERVAWPSANLMSCLRAAGAQVRTGKGTKSFKAATQSVLCPSEPFFAFAHNGKVIEMSDVLAFRDDTFSAHKKGAEALGFTLDVRRAAVGQRKHVRVRPRFDGVWTVTGELLVLQPEIVPQLETIFRIAGDIGIGDWRPGSPKSPGPFGRFTAELKIK